MPRQARQPYNRLVAVKTERRRYPRERPQETYVLACYNAEFPTRSTDHYNLATRLIDLGSKGLCMTTVGRLREGVPLFVDLSIPGPGGRFKAQGTVRWSQTLESRSRVAHVAGVEFEKVLEAFGEKVEFLTIWMRSRRRGPRRVTTPGPEPVRRHKRFAPEAGEVTCIPRGFWHALGFRKNVAHQLKDLSLGGAQIVSRKRIRPGRRIDLMMDFRNPRAIIRAQGVVRWCRRDTMTLESRWYVGVGFTRLTPEDDEHLRAIARHFRA